MSLKGVEETEEWAKKYLRGLARMDAQKTIVGSKLPYAYGIHFGRHQRSGRLARKAGGVPFLTNAVAQMQSGAIGDISQGLTKVQFPGPWVMKRLGLWVRRLARAAAPRGPGRKDRPYRLRRSINVQRR